MIEKLSESLNMGAKAPVGSSLKRGSAFNGRGRASSLTMIKDKVFGGSAEGPGSIGGAEIASQDRFMFKGAANSDS